VYLQTKEKNKKKTHGIRLTKTQRMSENSKWTQLQIQHYWCDAVQGPIQLPYLLYLALVSLCVILSTQPCPALNLVLIVIRPLFLHSQTPITPLTIVQLMLPLSQTLSQKPIYFCYSATHVELGAHYFP
jgi:hypothetical protein